MRISEKCVVRSRQESVSTSRHIKCTIVLSCLSIVSFLLFNYLSQVLWRIYFYCLLYAILLRRRRQGLSLYKNIFKRCFSKHDKFRGIVICNFRNLIINLCLHGWYTVYLNSHLIYINKGKIIQTKEDAALDSFTLITWYNKNLVKNDDLLALIIIFQDENIR